MKLTITTYNSSASIASETEILDVYYDAESLGSYSPEFFATEEEAQKECACDFREQLTDKFGSDIDNLDDILLTLSMHAENAIGSLWV